MSNKSIHIRLLFLYKAICFIVGMVFAVGTIAQQKEGNIWHFGKKAGIDFNFSPPKALTKSAISTGEGCASICNKNGDLLFYTDGSKVYNNQHNLMANGDNLKGHASSTQSAIIVPNPGNPNIYYIFSTSGKDSLYYSIVDMSLSVGLGAVTIKNIGLMAGGTEKLNAVRHRNGRDTWVVSHQRDNNLFYAFVVNATGVNLIPVISSVGSIFKAFSVGSLKFSPNGKNLVATQYLGSVSTVELFDFDDNLGKISNAEILISNSSRYYGAEFSPSGRYLYLTKTSSQINLLVQYSVFYNNIAAIAGSRVVISSMQTLSPGALQLGPDKRIYVAYFGTPFLGIIKMPEEYGFKCDFDKSGYSLVPGSLSQFGLPSFNQSFFYQPKVDIKTSEPTCGALNFVVKNIGDTSDVISSTWNFGDSTIGSGITVYKTYQKHGKYTLKNVVKTKYKNSIIVDTLTKEIHTQPLPKAVFTINKTEQCIKNNSFIFIDSSQYFNSTISQKSTWKYEDSLRLINKVSLVKKFNQAGQYTIKLVVISTDNCVDSISKKVTVKQGAKADFGVQHAQCMQGNEFTTTQLSNIAFPELILGYLWSFGDSSTAITPQPKKSYIDTGLFRIKMVANASNGCNDTIEKQVRVMPMPNTNYITTNGCSTDTIYFQNTSNSTKDLNSKYIWKFGDSIVTDNNITTKYYFDKKGKYDVVLIGENSFGCIDSIKKPVIVYPAPIAVFKWKGNCMGNTITLIDETERFQVLAKENTWVFDNNKKIKNLGDTYTTTKYNVVGNKTIQLVVEDINGCKDSITQQVYINPLPTANFEVDKKEQCLKGNKFITSNLSSSPKAKIKNSLWYINNSYFSDSVWIAASLKTWGKNTIKLKIITDSLCSDSIEKEVQINPQNNLDIQVNDSNQCERDNLFVFTNNSWLPIGNATYTWELSNGDVYTGKTIPPFSFNTAGRYLLKVFSETDKKCKDTARQVLKISFNPSVDFDVANICREDTAYFINTSLYSGGGEAKWLWFFGDGEISNQKEPLHQYISSGHYNVTLIGVSSEGCSDTIIKDSAIKVLPSPEAYFEIVSNENRNNRTHIEFENRTKFADVFYWTFGNDKFSPTINAKTTYLDTGKYKVSLYAENSNNCTDFFDTILHIKPEIDILIPNSFTPNKDPLNAVFKIEGSYYYREFEMQIFNRWGTKIFSSLNADKGWNGRYKDKLVPDGVYLYAIRLIGSDNKLHIYKGAVTLLR